MVVSFCYDDCVVSHFAVYVVSNVDAIECTAFLSQFHGQSPLVASPEPLELLDRSLAPRWPSGVPFVSRLRTPSNDGGRVFPSLAKLM